MLAYCGYFDRTMHQALPERYGPTFEQPLHEIVIYVGITATLIYYLLVYLDYPILPLQELLWNCLVSIVPTRIIFALDEKSLGSDTIPQGQGKRGTKSKDHAAKSEAMRRILGLDSVGLFAGLRRARSLSGIALKGDKERVIPPGLGNWDNSCYQNSVIQGLASLQSFREFLRSTTDHLGRLTPKPTINALSSIFESLGESSNASRRLWTPAELKSMSSWQQQDAQEYFSKVLDEVDRELLKAVYTIRVGGDLSEGAASLLNHHDTTAESEAQDRSSTAGVPVIKTHQTSVEKHDSTPFDSNTSHLRLPRSPLDGLLAQRVGCLRCGYVEGLSLIPFNCLTVPLSRESYQDIRDSLEAYTALEPIDGVECAKCTLLRSKEQLERLLRIPENILNAEDQHQAPNLSEVLRSSTIDRLSAVDESLEDEDFSETTLTRKCQIPARCRVATRKSRQAVIARAPSSLVIHVNRSVFDEMSGIQRKNYAAVTFPATLDIAPWCLGNLSRTDGGIATEEWETNPHKPMIHGHDDSNTPLQQTANYDLRAVITHYGRHENGHYICYRKHPNGAGVHDLADEDPTDTKAGVDMDNWWRFSDDEVTMVSEKTVLEQGGVFMLFYERLEVLAPPPPASPPTHDNMPTTNNVPETAPCIAERAALVDEENEPAPSSDEQAAAREEAAPANPLSPDASPPPPSPASPSPAHETPRVPPPMRTAGPHRKSGGRRRTGNALSSTSLISAN